MPMRLSERSAYAGIMIMFCRGASGQPVRDERRLTEQDGPNAYHAISRRLLP